MLISADAKGLEWVGINFLSQDPVGMQEIWDCHRDPSRPDQHTLNQASFGLPDRRLAKIFVFQLIYGGSAWSYANNPDFNFFSTDPDIWQGIIDKFYAKYDGIKRCHTAWMKEVAETGCWTSPTGRRFTYEPNWKGEWPRTTIINYPVQSLGHELMAIARVSLYKRMRKLDGLRTLMCNTIHDSLVLDMPEAEWYTIRTLIEEVFNDIPKNFERLFGLPFNLPMKAEIKRLDGQEIQ